MYTIELYLFNSLLGKIVVNWKNYTKNLRISVLILFKNSNVASYLSQARILKHAGDLEAAAALADEARCMDLADRYINSECVKRMLQADQVLIVDLMLYC